MLALFEFMRAIVSYFLAYGKLPRSHVPFFPVHELIWCAQNSTPLLSWNLKIDSPGGDDILFVVSDLQIEFEPPLSHTSRIPKTFVRSKMSCGHFTDLVCWDLMVKFPSPLTLFHSKVSTLSVWTFFRMLHNILKSFEPMFPG